MFIAGTTLGGDLGEIFAFFLHHFALETWKREVISLLNFNEYLPKHAKSLLSDRQ